MADENLALIRRAFHSWQEQGLPGLRQYLAPDFEFHEDPKFPEAGIYRGREAFELYASEFLSAWQANEWELEDALAASDDQVVTMFQTRWRGIGSGAEVEIKAGWVWTIRDGRAVRCRAFLSRDDALRVAGLSE